MWVCSCGQRNDGSFCTNCGRVRPGMGEGRPRGYAGALLPAPTRPRGLIKRDAKIGLALQCSTAIKALCLAWLLTILVSGLAGMLSVVMPLLGVLMVPMATVFVIQLLNGGQRIVGLLVYRQKTFETNDIFLCFREYSRYLAGLSWQLLWTSLWNLLPIIGIVKAYSYSFVPYILYDHPELTAKQALKQSMRLTDGHKMDLFVLDLSFIGWNLLNYMTVGILGFCYVTPYNMATRAGYYSEIIGESVRTNVVPDDFKKAVTSGGGSGERYSGGGSGLKQTRDRTGEETKTPPRDSLFHTPDSL